MTASGLRPRGMAAVLRSSVLAAAGSRPMERAALPEGAVVAAAIRLQRLAAEL